LQPKREKLIHALFLPLDISAAISTAKLTDRRPSESSGLAAGVLGGGSVQRLVGRAIYVKPV
jgi:hypothetical protein